MSRKPADFTGPTIHYKWDPATPFVCPVCGAKLEHEYNDGGRLSRTLRGGIWVVTNYYACTNPTCELHAAFPLLRENVMHRKHFALDVWAKVIRYSLHHHLNNAQIKGLLWEDWQVDMSTGTVDAILDFFEVAGSTKARDQTTLAVRAQGKIVLSLDGSRPIDGEPSLWIFSDRISGAVLHACLLETASHEVLVRLIREIQADFGVVIPAVISDRQESIVMAVREALPEAKHALCHFHFLHNAAAPVAAKDSHLLTRLRSEIRDLSLVESAKKAKKDVTVAPTDPVALVLAPLAEELLCAVSARGDRIKTFPGLEAYANLEFVQGRLDPILEAVRGKRLRRSLEAVSSALDRVLTTYAPLHEETESLAGDFQDLRKRLGRHAWRGPTVKRKVQEWAHKLERRLQRRGLAWKSAEIKWQRPTHDLPVEATWQEWLRLLSTHGEGLFVAYDDPTVDFTNNEKEGLFHACKRHFRALYGRANVSREYITHAPGYSQVSRLDLSDESIREVLLACETAFLEAGRRELHARYATYRRAWKIRVRDTGNFARLRENLTSAGELLSEFVG